MKFFVAVVVLVVVAVAVHVSNFHHWPKSDL